MNHGAGVAFTNFKDFLKVLVNPNHKLHQSAWYEFDRRYRVIMLANIHKITSRPDDVKEIIQIIMEKLVSNDFKVLRNFQAVESESAFKVYLSEISWTTALGYVNKIKKTTPLNEDLPIEDTSASKDMDASYKESVELLRAALSGSQKKKFNQERDIFIYLLRRYGDFKSKEVAQIPLLDTSEHNIDIVVNRIENLVKNKKNNLRDFL